MLKNTFIKINADKSITENFPYKIYQGEINTHKFIIDPSLVINDTSNVVGYIGFKRIDNQKSGFVPLKKEQDGTFTYVIKDYWTLNLVGKVWYTIKFVSVSGNNQLEYQLYAGNSSFTVNPLADYILGDDLPPDTSTILQEQIDNLQEQINDNASNIDSKLNKEFNTYPKLNWEDVDNKDIIALNRVNQDGTVSQYYAEAEDLYNTVNNIRADGDGNIQITGEDININSTSNITIDEEISLKVNKSEPLVYYQDSSLPIQEPMISIYRAEIADRAVADGNGNNIINTYSTKSELETTNNAISSINSSIENLNSSINDVNNSLSDINDSLSEDISNVQTQVTNLSTSITNNYDTSLEVDNKLNTRALKSVLVYSGQASSTWVDFQTIPSFTPKHYIVEYTSSLVNVRTGTCIVGIGIDNHKTSISWTEYTKITNNEFNIGFYTATISVFDNKISSNVTYNYLEYLNNNFTLGNIQSDSLYVNVYAVDI